MYVYPYMWRSSCDDHHRIRLKMCLLLDLHLLLYLAKDLFLGFQAWDVYIKTHCFSKCKRAFLKSYESHLLVSICNEILFFFKDIISDGKFYIHKLFQYKGFWEQYNCQSLWLIWIYTCGSDEILQSPKLCFRQWLKRQPLPVSGVGTEVMMIYDSSLRGLILRWVTCILAH